MFDRHQRTISAYARASADNFFRVALFVILTVRQPFDLISQHMRETEGGDTFQHLWGWKAQAHRELSDRRVEVFEACEAIYRAHPDPDVAAVELLCYVSALHGFGLAKAGFLIQLVYGLTGCLDGRNKERYGIGARRFELPPVITLRRRQRHARDYQDTINGLGGCSHLWDIWCEGLARPGGRLSTAHEVSAEHCRALGLAA